MPGIFGLAPIGNGIDVAATLDAMAGCLKHHPWYREGRLVDRDAGVALGRVSLGIPGEADRPARSPDGSVLAVMDGEIYEPDERRRGLAPAGAMSPMGGQAELLIRGYQARGRDFFAGLRGKFSAALWDSKTSLLILTNDRFGMKPLYYTTKGGRLMLASEIKALLACPGVPRRRDWRGLAQFFTFGQPLGEDNLFEEIRLVPPAGWVVFDAIEGRVTVDRYWRISPGKVDPRVGVDEALDRIDAAFVRSVDRCIAGGRRIGLSLSGGLDSRAILGVMDHDRTRITSISLGVKGGADHDAARRMADRVGCPHHCFLLDGSFLSDFEGHLRRMVRLTDGQYLSNCIIMPTIPFYRELGVEVLLRGHAGELMHMDKAYSFTLDRASRAIRDEAGLEGWLLDRLGAGFRTPYSLFSPALAGPMQELARDSLRSCLAESLGFGPAVDRISLLFLGQRLRRETAVSLVKFGSQMETRLPYLDNDLVDLLLTTPHALRRSDTIQAHILARRRPEFLRIANANTGAPIGAGRASRLLARARIKVLGKIGVPGYRHYEDMARWLREDLRPLVVGTLLGERFLDRGIFDPGAIRAILEDHQEGRRNYAYLILALMIFEFGQREMIDEDPPAEASPPSEPSASVTASIRGN